MVIAQFTPEGTSKEGGHKKSCVIMRLSYAASFKLRFGKWNLVLAVCSIFIVSLILSLLQRADRKQARLRAKCWELSQLLKMKIFSGSVQLHKAISNKEQDLVAKKGNIQTDDKRILEHLLLMQECPWEPDVTAVAQYRAELRRCCNASFSLVLTKENAPLGSSIILDGNKNRKLSVNADLFDLLPKRLPFSDTHYGHCAVVGNGGVLRNSRCGHEIDQADLVVRFNMPPMNFSEDVGTKTTLITINPSILQLRFKNLQARRKPFADALHPYRKALFLIPAFSFVGHNTLGYRALYTMEDFGWPQQMFFLNPHYMATLSNHWREKGLHPQRLSSGFMFVNVALEFCEHITLYGFWPFGHDLDDQPIPHHYYDNVLPKAGIHAMPSEYSHYLNMYAQGVLQLQLGKCH